MRSIIALTALAFLASSAQAQAAAAVSTADWRFFGKNSYSQYFEQLDDPSWEDRLFTQSKLPVAAAIAGFARDIQVPVDAAQVYAHVIIESVRFRDACDYPGPCRFGPGEPFYELVTTVAVKEGSGELLAVAGMNLEGATDGTRNEAIFIRATHEAEGALAAYRRIFNYNEDAAFLIALLAKEPRSEAIALRAATGRGPDAGPDALDGWFDAYLEVAERNAQSAPPRVRAALAQARLIRWFGLGLSDEALAAYLAYPEEVRALVPVPYDCEGCNDRKKELSLGSSQQLADDLTAALWQAGRRSEARALLQRGELEFGARTDDSAARYLALKDSIEPRLSDEAVFGAYVLGDRAPPKSNAGFEKGGWAFSVVNASRPLRLTVTARLRAAGYADVAQYLERGFFLQPPDEGAATLRTMSWLLPDAAPRQPYWRDRIAAAYAQEREQSAPVGEPHVATAPMDPWWTVERLAARARPWPEDRRTKLPSQVSLPVPEEEVIRYEARGGEEAIVYRSTQYDQPGEVPSYGVWFARTSGGTWQRPIYLGLQTYFPYMPAAGSAVPLVDGDALRLEVQVREIDPDSITFPPVGLSMRRSEDGVVLVFSLARLLQDSDGDGLTDIEERRIGLAVRNPDTDGDGLDDLVDPLPLTPFDADATPERRALAQAILGEIMGHERGAIMVGPQNPKQAPLDIFEAVMGGTPRPRASVPTVFMVADDPTLFAGLQSRRRFIIYSPRDLDALSNGAAPFYPPQLQQVFSSHDGHTHYVIWSASWTGGTFIVRCPEGARDCKVQEVSRWIT